MILIDSAELIFSRLLFVGFVILTNTISTDTCYPDGEDHNKGGIYTTHKLK